jgi:peptidyl-prolyl cis-trans isomerase D
MLLGLMRKHARSWLIKVLMVIITLVFVFYFGYSFNAGKGLKVAVVNGEVISQAEYSKAYHDLYEGFRRQYKEIWNENMVKLFDLKNMALNNLINQKLISHEAQRIGLFVTDSEVQKTIMGFDAFQVHGHFDMQRYKDLLSNNRMRPEDFEASMTQDLLNKKLTQFLSTFVHVTDQEILDHYTFLNEKVKIAFMRFLPEKFKDKIKFDQSDLKGFFEKNKEQYRIPENIQLTYLLIDPEIFRDQVKIREDEIKSYYEYHKEEFKRSGEDQPKLLEDVRGEITEIMVKQVCADLAHERGLSLLDQMPYDVNLAEYAVENELKTKRTDYFSKDESIPGLGGDKQLKESLFALRDNETSNLIALNGRFYLFQLAERKNSFLPDINQVMDQVKKDLVKDLAANKAKMAAETYLAGFKAGKNWDEFVREKGVDLEETFFFTRRDPVPKIGSDASLSEALFALNEHNRYLDKVYVNNNGVFVIRWLGAKGVDKQEFEKEKETFSSRVVADKRRRIFESWIVDLRKKAEIKIINPVT